MDNKLSLDLDTLEIETFAPVPSTDEESVEAYAATAQGTCMGYTCFITCTGKFC